MSRNSVLFLALLTACGSDQEPPLPTIPDVEDERRGGGGPSGDDDPTLIDDTSDDDHDTVNVIEQEWDDADRTLFWHLPQGSYIVPYDWFMALENEAGMALVDRLESMGYIGSWFDDALNPDVLPIGFTIENPSETDKSVFGLEGRWLGINCAACHVGAIEHDGELIVIDGGPALADLQELNFAIANDLRSTLADEERMSAFVARVSAASSTRSTRERVRQQVISFLGDFDGYLKNSFHDENGRRLNPGAGRVDAFGVILNQVASKALGLPENRQVPNAPVSYPFVWDSPDLAWVQYNGLAQNPFSRNIGEVLGVYGRIQLDPAKPDYLASTVRYDELLQIEQTLRRLEPPTWAEVFGEEPAESTRGEQLYAQRCDGCHPRVPKRQQHVVGVTPEGKPIMGDFEQVQLFPQPEIGTDRQFLDNLISRGATDMSVFADSSPLAKSDILAGLPFMSEQFKTVFLQRLAQVPPLKKVDSAATLLGMVTGTLAFQYYRDADVPVGSEAYFDSTNKAGTSGPPNPLGYKARTLRGIFATGPFLHNGSVRTLRDLLRPEDQREETFRIGSYKFDDEEVGYVSAGNTEFNTALVGNSNAGHSGTKFGTDLSDDDADALVQFMKTL